MASMERQVLNSLVAEIVSESGLGFRQVHTMVNIAVGVTRRDQANPEQLRQGLAYAADWLARLQRGWAGVKAIVDAAPSSRIVCNAGQMAELRRVLLEGQRWLPQTENLISNAATILDESAARK
jgi:hypothetical protein